MLLRQRLELPTGDVRVAIRRGELLEERRVTRRVLAQVRAVHGVADGALRTVDVVVAARREVLRPTASRERRLHGRVGPRDARVTCVVVLQQDGETFVDEHDVTPVLGRHGVAEPHVRVLVRDEARRPVDERTLVLDETDLLLATDGEIRQRQPTGLRERVRAVQPGEVVERLRGVGDEVGRDARHARVQVRDAHACRGELAALHGETRPDGEPGVVGRDPLRNDDARVDHAAVAEGVRGRRAVGDDLVGLLRRDADRVRGLVVDAIVARVPEHGHLGLTGERRHGAVLDDATGASVEENPVPGDVVVPDLERERLPLRQRNARDRPLIPRSGRLERLAHTVHGDALRYEREVDEE